MDPKVKKTSGSAPATLIVCVPADATLTIDDRPTSSTSEMRVFTTPPLPVASEHTYTLRAQVTRDGMVRTETRQVIVRGGAQTQVRLDVPHSTPGIAVR
ncbi:MAG: TIGR03000 domain-containing protein [Planctomycetes bacterium]|nr:TIGR03000 domain-containing protein [Planctomycetota bacterium]